MEILINELSLNGQFASDEQFIGNALPPLISLLREVDYNKDLLLKKHDFFASKITANTTIYDIIVGNISRQYDEIRRLKLHLVCLFENPYWEDSQKHSVDCVYLYNSKNVCQQSLAEACERDKVVISFVNPEFSSTNLTVNKEQEEINEAKRRWGRK